MASRSVLGCQRPFLVVVGLAILCSVPYAKAGVGEHLNKAFNSPVLELAPGFRDCFQACYARHGGKVSSVQSSESSVRLAVSVLKEFDDAVAPLRENGPLTDQQERALNWDRGNSLQAGINKEMGKCLGECEDMLGAGDEDVMLKVFLKSRPSMDYLIKATQNWVNAIPSERENRGFLVGRTYAKLADSGNAA